MTRHRVVIIGGGFAGLRAAQHLRSAPVEVTLLDRRNFHLFQPLLYQVATGALSPADICSPLRAVLKRQAHTRVLQTNVTGLDVSRRRVILPDGDVSYDSLIVAAGARHHYFGHPGWASRAPGLKTVEDATEIRSRILGAFERAERCSDRDEREALLTFVIVGGGPTGVELAGAIGEMARHTLKNNFRNFDPADARILLVEGVDRVLPPYPDRLSAAARSALERLGVEVHTETYVSEIDERTVVLEKRGVRSTIRCQTILWAAGVQASPLARVIADETGARLDDAGRVHVGRDCSLPEHPEIFVVGDMAHCRDADGNPLPGVAAVAMQQGGYVARCIRDRLSNKTTPIFRYRDKGSLAVIGRAAAVAHLGRLNFTGYPAWLLWLFVHIMMLVEFENRVLVFTHWAFSYFTRKRGARLITGQRE